jgi:hypothetical protein
MAVGPRLRGAAAGQCDTARRLQDAAVRSEEIRYEVYARRNWTRSRIYEWHQEMRGEELKSNAVRICEVYQSHASIFLRNSRRLSLLREPQQVFRTGLAGRCR